MEPCFADNIPLIKKSSFDDDNSKDIYKVNYKDN